MVFQLLFCNAVVLAGLVQYKNYMLLRVIAPLSLLKNGCDNGVTPLGYAIMGGDTEAARILINAGASLETRSEVLLDESGRVTWLTPLGLARKYHCPEIEALLLQKHAPE